MKETLYDVTKKGKVYIWTVDVTEQDSNGCINITRGLQTGKKTTTTQIIKKGKNIGKANETTPYEQALSQARSKLTKKLDSGYGYTLEESKQKHSEELKPMLAQSYDKHMSKLKYPCYVQPKLDGIRCLGRKENGVVTLYSRQGKVLNLIPHINEQLDSFLAEGDCTDGEIYVHGWDFQKIVSAVKKTSENTPLLQYHIYDLPMPDVSFNTRFSPHIQAILVGESIHVVDTVRVPTQQDLHNYEESCVSKGYEGIMGRNEDSKYLFGYRSTDLLKIKRFTDSEYEIVNVTEGTSVEEGLAIFVCKTASGLQFSVRPMGTHGERKIMFNNKESFIGKLLTVKYQELTNDGIPRFPVGLHIRETWDM